MSAGKELEEKFRAKIADLDKRMKEIEEEMKGLDSDSPEYEDLMDESISVMCTTNRYLRAIHADESEMYDI